MNAKIVGYVLALLHQTFQIRTSARTRANLDTSDLVLFGLHGTIRGSVITSLRRLLRVLLLGNEYGGVILLTRLLVPRTHFVGATHHHTYRVFTRRQVRTRREGTFLHRRGVHATFALRVLRGTRVVRRLDLVGRVTKDQRHLRHHLLALYTRVLLRVDRAKDALDLISGVYQRCDFLNIHRLVLP